MFRNLLFVVLSLCLATVIYAEPTPVELDFGVYTADKPTTVVRQFRPLLNALEQQVSQELSRPVKIRMNVAPSYEQGKADLLQGKVMFSRLGPASYIEVKDSLPSLRLLAMEARGGKKRFMGIIAVPKSSPIQSVAQLKGHSFAFGNQSSTIGRYLAQLHLLENGVRAKDLSRMDYLDRHDAVGDAVASEKFDAGALKEGTYLKLLSKDRQLRVLDSFPNVTKPWIAHPSMPEEIFQALQRAMFNLKDDEAFKRLHSGGADGFVMGEDADYDRIRAAISRNPEFFEE